jgi:hypothetical protein
MKQIVVILLSLLLALEAKAQLIRDEWGEVIPFSLSHKYKNLIDTSKINTRLYNSYNNDSLFTKLNKKYGFTKNSSIKIGVMPIDSTQIDFKQVASKFIIDEGTVWMYRLESKTAEGFAIHLSLILMPDSEYFSFYSNDVDPPNVFLKKDITNNKISGITYGTQLVFEFFEPKKTINGNPIIIKQINYIFIYPFKTKEKSTETGDNINLKSVGHGNAFNQCQRNLDCTIIYSMA